MITIEDIRSEHEAAMASLTPQQRRALDRVREACQQTNFNGRSPKENLLSMFRREADIRTERLSAA
jgi:DNA-binding PadR family transcriptional regulator